MRRLRYGEVIERLRGNRLLSKAPRIPSIKLQPSNSQDAIDENSTFAFGSTF